MYFKDVAHEYGLPYDVIAGMGDVDIWKFIIKVQWG